MNPDALPPHSPETELALLGYLLTDAPIAFAAIESAGVHAGHFFDLRHRRVFSECAAMHADGQAVSIITILPRLKSSVPATATDWLALLTSATHDQLSPHVCGTLCDQLVDLHRRRVALDVARRIGEAAQREDCGDVLADTQHALESLTRGFNADNLPPIEDAAEFTAADLPQPRELVRCVLHQGGKLVLGGGSKAFKTWVQLDLAISVAHGLPWLGNETVQGPVLYLNFEIQNHAWQRRIAAVADAKGITLKPGAISLWNLRGHAADFRSLLPRIAKQAKANRFSLIVLDPIYKLYGATDENKASDVAALLNGLEKLAVDTGAAIAFGAHFAKGNASQKEAIDRISGSGVFARDPDAILMFTRHEEEDAFTVEPILRNFAPIEPFAVRWEFPLMRRANELDPAKLKQPGGRKAEYSPDDLLKLLPPAGLTNGAWLDVADESEGIARRTFYRLRKTLESGGKVTLSKVTDRWTPICPKAKP